MTERPFMPDFAEQPVRPADLIYPDRRVAIAQMRCIKPPEGCGKPIEGFRDQGSAAEYELSALCQDCQDAVFSSGS